MKALVLGSTALAIAIGLVVSGSSHARLGPASSSGLRAAPAVMVPVQGLLTDLEGRPIHGATSITFSLYADAVASAPVWTEAHTVEVDRGLFTVYLGGLTPLAAELFRDHSAPYLSMRVESDAEMARWPLGNTPLAAFASLAGDAETVGGKASTEFLLRTSLGEITGPMLADGAVDTQQLAFDPSTQGELDAHRASADHDGRYFTKTELQNAGTVNDAANPVHWTKIKGMPSGFADGSDDGTVASDVQCVGCVGDQDVGAGAIGGGHIASGSIAVSQLAFDPATQAELAAYATQASVAALAADVATLDTRVAALERFVAPALSAPPACGAADRGRIYFDSAANAFSGCNGTVWVTFATSP